LLSSHESSEVLSEDYRDTEILKLLTPYTKKEATKLSHDGSSTYGELTDYSNAKWINKMIKAKIITKESVFCDAGSGFGRVVAHVHLAASCRAFGIENAENRHFVACDITKRLLSQLQQPKIALYLGDLRNLFDFGPTTFLYMFDEAFPPDLVDHILLCACNTENLQYIYTFKASKAPKFKGTFAAHGWELIDEHKLRVRKVVSGETNTMYLYKRGNRVRRPGLLEFKHGCAGTLEPQALRQCLEMSWVQGKAIEYLEQFSAEYEHTGRSNRIIAPSTICRCELHAQYSRTREGGKSNVLYLGMVYGSPDVSDHMIRRDSLRCRRTEHLLGVNVFTISKRDNDMTSIESRHVKSSFGSNKVPKHFKEMLEGFHDKFFIQIVMDYFWCPNGWASGVARELLHSLLPLLYEHGLAVPGTDVYLPFHADLLLELAKWELAQRKCANPRKRGRYLNNMPFDVEYISATDLKQMGRNMLWYATSAIEREFPDVLGKENNQENKYCVVERRRVKELNDECQNSKLLQKLADIDTSHYRFIRLKVKK
jgi:Histone methylation protein DOT1